MDRTRPFLIAVPLLLSLSCTAPEDPPDPVFDVLPDTKAEGLSDACVPDCSTRECGNDGCGGSCGTCPPGKTCSVGGFCLGGENSCSNNIQNGLETDVDCGGPCGGCPVGKACKIHSDCLAQACQSGICVEGLSCDSLVKDGLETDVDCGGPDCQGCPLDGSCLLHSDCKSLHCDKGLCKEPTCQDGSHNQDETDKDCGGTICPGCPDDSHCLDDGDCLAGFCHNEVCGPCVGSCQDKDCGDDGCGQSCGSCGTMGFCGEEGTCVQGDGACENDGDMSIILEDDNFDPAMLQAIVCATDLCFSVEVCINNCLVSELGLSAPCAACYGAVGVCSYFQCQNACAMDSSSVQCVTCVASSCLKDLEDCTGLSIDDR